MSRLFEPMTDAQFEDAVRHMRACQRTYFRSRGHESLMAAKQWEHKVDGELYRREVERGNAPRPLHLLGGKI